MAGEVVVDASVVGLWSLADPRTPVASGLAAHWITSQVQMLAPPLLPPEINNAAYQRVRRGLLTLAQAQAAVGLALAVDVRIVDHPRLQEQSLDLAGRFNLRASYDAQYLALAQLHGCSFWTGDERLYNSVRLSLPWVHWLGDSDEVAAVLGSGARS